MIWLAVIGLSVLFAMTNGISYERGFASGFKRLREGIEAGEYVVKYREEEEE